MRVKGKSNMFELSMIRSEHTEGSNAWYDDLEASLVADGIVPTAEKILMARERIMNETGRYIPDDQRFLSRYPQIIDDHKAS